MSKLSTHFLQTKFIWKVNIVAMFLKEDCIRCMSNVDYIHVGLCWFFVCLFVWYIILILIFFYFIKTKENSTSKTSSSNTGNLALLFIWRWFIKSTTQLYALFSFYLFCLNQFFLVILMTLEVKLYIPLFFLYWIRKCYTNTSCKIYILITLN